MKPPTSINMLGLFIFFFITFFQYAQADEKQLTLVKTNLSEGSHADLNWYVFHWPPLMILEGDDKGEGIIDSTLQILIDGLPQYKHKIVRLPVARAFHETKNGANGCFPALLKIPEREDFILYSQYSVMYKSIQAITRKNTAFKHTFTDNISLSDTLTNTKLVLGVQYKRSYGDKIDQLIYQFRDSGQVVFRAGDSKMDLFSMLAKKRIDIVLGFPYEALYAEQVLKSKPKLRSFNITETDKFVYGSVGCSKTSWGKEVITQVNKLLDKEKNKSYYRESLGKWLLNSDKDADYWQHYETVFLKN
ncbi:TIGR02285 family protein [Flocculibacter collagenilyticus]|uniref:TIGR02285 family protein n=1 Tax=Flocculibacter collagenilyticus TaxID=2744479 RepID=UPI0018F3E69B|nr:TIGR02285 family protein [Flocculibacter collagenilyticus]